MKYVVKEDLKSELHPILEGNVTVWGGFPQTKIGILPPTGRE